MFFFGKWFEEVVHIKSAKLCDIYHFALGASADDEEDGGSKRKAVWDLLDEPAAKAQKERS